MKQKNLWLLVGSPASGKSSWVRNKIKDSGGAVISRDEIRFSLLEEGDEYFAKENHVFDTFVEYIQEALKTHDNVYADATNLHEPSRDKLLCALDLDGINVNAVNFCVPLDICIERNNLREGKSKVPTSVLRRMYFSKTNPENDILFQYNIIINVDKDGKEF